MIFLFKQETIDYDFFNRKKKNTILFLHGWGGNKFSFASTISLLKNQYNILTLTMPTIQNTTTSFDMFDYVNMVSNLLSLYSLNDIIVVCHSFGFRVAMLLKKFFHIKKIIVTGGAGFKKQSYIKKIETKNNKILLKQKRFKYLYNNIASDDYTKLSNTNKTTFKYVVNLDLKFAKKFNCPMLLFWGNHDKETKLWIAKQIKKCNNAKQIITNSNHFAYINENAKFNNEVLKFLNDN